MAHTYVITSAVSQGNTCTVMGTVDGFVVTIYVPLLSLTSLPSTAAVQNLIAPMMLANAVAQGLIAPTTPTVVQVTAAGTFSQ
jgi:hypothetical protein